MNEVLTFLHAYPAPALGAFIGIWAMAGAWLLRTK